MRYDSQEIAEIRRMSNDASDKRWLATIDAIRDAAEHMRTHFRALDQPCPSCMSSIDVIIRSSGGS